MSPCVIWTGKLSSLWQDYALRDEERNPNRRAFSALLAKAREASGSGLDEAAMDYLAWVRRCLFRDTVAQACEDAGLSAEAAVNMMEAVFPAREPARDGESRSRKREFAGAWERAGRADPESFLAFSDALSKKFLKLGDGEMGRLRSLRQGKEIGAALGDAAAPGKAPRV